MISSLLFAAIAAPALPVSDWFVDGTVAGPGTGTQTDPYASIEYALAASSTLDGDTIYIAPGTYSNQILDLQGKAVTLTASAGVGTVTVQGPGVANAVGSGGQALVRADQVGGAGAALIGLRLLGGGGEDTGTQVVGGVLYAVDSAVSFVDCELQGTALHHGGAVYAEGSNITLVDSGIQATLFWPAIPGGLAGLGAGLWCQDSTVVVTGGVLGVPGNLPWFSQSHHGLLATFENCQTALSGVTLQKNAGCTYSCSAESQVLAENGSIVLDGCIWVGSPAGAHRLVESRSAPVEFRNMLCNVPAVGGNAYPGRALHVTGADAVIENCTFQGEGLGTNDDSPAFWYQGGGLVFVDGTATVTDSLFSGCSHVNRGGALFGNHVVLQGCTFENNQALGAFGIGPYSGYGGAVHAGTLTATDCTFVSNRAWVSDFSYWQLSMGNTNMNAYGGAVAMGSGSFVNCEFRGNAVLDHFHGTVGRHFGGAVHATGPVSFDGCRFYSNRAKMSAAIFNASPPPEVISDGGALHLLGGATLTDCDFVGNSVDSHGSPYADNRARGGAIYGQGALVLENCRFRWNSAEEGAAVYLTPGNTGEFAGTLFDSNPCIEEIDSDVTVAGLAWYGMASAERCTLVRSADGSGPITLFGVGSTLDSSILWDLHGATIPAGTVIEYSTVQGGYAGLGNSAENPLMWGGGDWRLQPASPAIDAGNPARMDTDGSRSDMGAYPNIASYCGAPDSVAQCAMPLGTFPCSSNPNSSGQIAGIGGYGDPAASNNNLQLACSNVASDSLGFFLASPNADFVPSFGGSAGNLCLGAGLLRLNDQLLRANSGGRAGRILDTQNLVPGTAIQAGSTWHFQFWFRDAGLPGVSNTSGSIAIPFQ
ncbi:MAG: hypothetical protein R3F33_18175 [Planctomycetota bacterium]